jgi:copper chaperone CopZ
MNTTAADDWTLPIEGMTCASCVARVEKAVRAVPGVQTANVNLATEALNVQGTAALREPVIAAVRRAGYEVPQTQLTLDIEGMTWKRPCRSCPVC